MTVHVNNPYKSNPSAVEVIIQQTETPVFAGLFVPSLTIANRAVAAAAGSYLRACVLALGDGSTTSAKELRLDASAVVNAPNCVLASNDAIDPNAVEIAGTATITAGGIVSRGGCDVSGKSCTSSSQVTLTDPPKTNQPPVLDPSLAAQAVALPTPTTAGFTCRAWPSSIPASPGPTFWNQYTAEGGA